MNTSSSVNTLQTATAAFEAGAGLALLCFPSVAVALLLGVPLETPASLAVARVEVERIEGSRLESTGARREPDSLDDLRHASDDRGLGDLAPRCIRRDLRYVPLWVDGPLDDEVSFDAGVVLQGLVVAGASLIAMCDDDCTNILGPAPRVVRMRPLGRRLVRAR